jgi:hypothetical protein
MEIAWWKTGLFQPLLQDTSSRSTERPTLSNRTMTGSLPNDKETIIHLTTHNRACHRDITMFLAESARENALL